jgi:hypothetical protein
MGSQLQRFLGASLFLVATGQPPSIASPDVQFSCHTGYSQEDCDVQLNQLGRILVRIDLAPLGDWSWILVRSEDWQPILRSVGRDPKSPAFTILQKRQIYLEEALFNPSPARARELFERWRLPRDELRIVAVTHELGHAICQEPDEARANAYAEQLRSTGKVTCLAASDQRK